MHEVYFKSLYELKAGVNPDLERWSSRMVQCHIVYPSARHNLQIRICHW